MCCEVAAGDVAGHPDPGNGVQVPGLEVAVEAGDDQGGVVGGEPEGHLISDRNASQEGACVCVPQPHLAVVAAGEQAAVVRVGREAAAVGVGGVGGGDPVR